MQTKRISFFNIINIFNFYNLELMHVFTCGDCKKRSQCRYNKLKRDNCEVCDAIGKSSYIESAGVINGFKENQFFVKKNAKCKKSLADIFEQYQK